MHFVIVWPDFCSKKRQQFFVSPLNVQIKQKIIIRFISQAFPDPPQISSTLVKISLINILAPPL